MPYRSKAQQRWAHATKQPWAREWDEETKKLKKGKKRGFKAIPERVKKGAEMSTSAFGVEHNISKADRYGENPRVGRLALGGAAPGFHGAAAGRDSKKKFGAAGLELLGGPVGTYAAHEMDWYKKQPAKGKKKKK